MKKDFALTYIFQWTMIMSYLGCISSDNLMCSLSIYADNTLYQSFNKTPIQHRRAAITRLIENIISDANAIFMEKKNKILISRSPDGKLYKQIQLIIRKITIFDDYRCSNINNFSEEEKILCNDKVGSSVLLNEISKKDLSNFCLGYIFTNRDFEGDIVGLAWVAATNKKGGICDHYERYRNGKRSHNSGVITTRDISIFGKIVEIFTHEILHSFGSKHDTDPNCLGDAVNGTHIMHPKVVYSSMKPNNRLMSTCTKRYISEKIDQILYGSKINNCFLDVVKPICNNGIVDKEESCDCGEKAECMLLGDKCCNPSTCFFFEGKVCSPTNNVCCDTDCTFIPKVKNKICREESQCQYSSICGYEGKCEDPINKPENTVCGKSKTMFCQSGICQKTICQLLNQIDCDSDPNDLDYESLCYLSCQENKNGKCINYRNSPEFVLNSIRNIINVSSFTTDFRREKHSKCFLKNNKLGYCDFKLKCRPFDPDSPFQPLYDFFNGDYLEDNIKIILTRYWWAVVLGSMSIILFMGLIVHCFAIYTPTNNPNAQPAKSIKHSFYNVGNTIKRMSIVNNPNPRQFQLAHMSNRK